MEENNNKISKKWDLGCKKILKNGVSSKMDDGKCTLVRSYIKKEERRAYCNGLASSSLII